MCRVTARRDVYNGDVQKVNRASYLRDTTNSGGGYDKKMQIGMDEI